jgi:glycerophosphoryl diester phosphodiesterase
MKTSGIWILAFVLMMSCKRNVDAPVPDTGWDLFQSPNAQPLPHWSRPKLEGVYTFTAAGDFFGTAAALKWSYTANGTDTLWNLSAFCQADATYFILEGRQLNGDILLNGYWRRKVNAETGRMRLTLSRANGGTAILDANSVRPPSIVINGVYGLGNALPQIPVELRFNRLLRNSANFEILAHRGGGRNADLLPASENSIEMLRLASRLGATGVEIDIQQTSDKELILYHDATLNERLIKKNGMVGPVENYSLAQLNALVQLVRGGKIPTLRQALTTILEETPIRFVWLDTKFKGSLETLRQIQQEFLQRAVIRGRQLDIVIGLPTDDEYNQFRLLSNHQNIPSLSELDVQKTNAINARIWAPTWTLGLQNNEVAAMQAQGRRAFVWTLDSPDRIQQFLNEGRFDGILSNQPAAVAYAFYTKQ